jgi:uncharacterized protein YprB with RNaseH-like and TPR domain
MFIRENKSETEKLKQKLLKKYKNKKLEDVFNCKKFKTKKGICYNIKTKDRVVLKTINSSQTKKKILSHLKSIESITETETEKILKILNKPNIYKINDWIAHKFPKSHPLVFCLSGFHKKENFIFFDIETIGNPSSGMPIILFGVAQISGSQILINQYFLQDIKEEPTALIGFLSHFDKNSIFITFGGKAFDIPYIMKRLAHYRINEDFKKPHFDMLYFSRHAWGEELPNCRLTTIEKHLFGIKRKNDIPNTLIPEFYQTYMETKNIGPIISIIEHNKQDIITLINIFSKLHENWK